MSRLHQKFALTLLLLASLLGGCASEEMRLANLAKTDIDMVADLHLQQAEELLQELLVKLYKRNPRELHKVPAASIDSRSAQLFGQERSLLFAELDNRRGVAAMLQGLAPDYGGDRVFALMVGLVSMVRHAYGDHEEFFLLDSVDPQILYNSARNIEVLVWRLKARQDETGMPLLLTNSLPGEARNLSFERLFGKLIALQDMLAQIAAQKWNRTINFVVHRAATAAFLPIGL